MHMFRVYLWERIAVKPQYNAVCRVLDSVNIISYVASAR